MKKSRISVELSSRCINMMNRYCLFLKIPISRKQGKVVLNIPISRKQGKMQVFEQQDKCLTLHRVNFRPIWT